MKLIEDPKKAGIPPFLQTQNRRQLTAEEQQRVKAFMAFTPPQQQKQQLPDDLKIDQAAMKKARQSNRIARLKNSVKYRELNNPIWDPRRNRWIDGDEDYRNRMRNAAVKLGIKLKEEQFEMANKITVQAYLTGATENDMSPSERGKSSVSAKAEQFEISAKVRHVVLRVGAKKVGKVEVINPEGVVIRTYVPDEARGNMVSTTESGTDTVSLAPDQSEDNSKMSKRPKAKKAASKGNGRLGIIDTIREMIKRDKGASISEMVTALKSKHPGRSAKGMESTCRIQAPKNSKSHEDIEKRGGRVYYATA